MRKLPDIVERAARILIVDDQRQNRDLFEIMLAASGFEIQTASTGAEALASVAELPPDLVLLDVMMPEMDGQQVAEKLKGNAVTSNIPIIMVTALDDREARMAGLSVGAEDFLTWPVDRAELCARVTNLLRLKAYGDHHDKYGRMLEGEMDVCMADLVESERLYRSTFDAAPIGIVHMGLDGRWLRVNQRLCDLLGYTREELQSAGIQALVQPQPAKSEATSFQLLVAGTLDRYVIDEKCYRRSDGSPVWARVNMSVHRNAAGAPLHLISVIEDITERRLLEAQILQANKLEAIGGLASGVAHDFNNILSVVLGYCELLVQDLREGDPACADLNEIKLAGLRACDLTRQLLAFSRQQILQPKIVDMVEVVEGMAKMLRRLIGDDVELTAIGASGRGKIMVDPGQMEQVVMNLAVNARDAMPTGGKLTIETAEVLLDETFASEHVGVNPGLHVMLAVSDTGVGMDKATQARMFEPFFTTKEVGKGTGLGLATVFGIVRQSGGTIWVESEPGMGATFKVYFPTVAGEVAARDAPRSPVGTLRGAETVLLVEDDECVRTLVRTILLKFGYHVLDARSGGEALLMCEQHPAPIHILLTDVVMPKMNGRQLAERLRVLRPALKVVYMSGYTDEAVARHGLSGSTVAFLQKPITPDALGRKLREVLDGQSQAPAHH